MARQHLVSQSFHKPFTTVTNPSLALVLFTDRLRSEKDVKPVKHLEDGSTAAKSADRSTWRLTRPNLNADID